MCKVVIPEVKGLFCAIDGGGAGIVSTNAVLVLVFIKYFVHGDGNQFTGFIFETEAQRRDLPVGICSGNHLHRNIYTQYAFHEIIPFKLRRQYMRLSGLWESKPSIPCERMFVNRNDFQFLRIAVFTRRISILNQFIPGFFYFLFVFVTHLFYGSAIRLMKFFRIRV